MIGEIKEFATNYTSLPNIEDAHKILYNCAYDQKTDSNVQFDKLIAALHHAGFTDNDTSMLVQYLNDACLPDGHEQKEGADTSFYLELAQEELDGLYGEIDTQKVDHETNSGTGLNELRQIIREEIACMHEEADTAVSTDEPDVHLIVIAAIVRGEIEKGPSGFTVVDASTNPYHPGNSHPVIMWKKITGSDDESVVAQAELVAKNWQHQIRFDDDERGGYVKTGHVMVHFVNADTAVWSSFDIDDPAYLFDNTDACNGTFVDYGIPITPRRRGTGRRR